MVDYMAIHYMAIHYMAIHYMAIHYMAIQYMAIHYMTRISYVCVSRVIIRLTYMYIESRRGFSLLLYCVSFNVLSVR